MEEGEYKTGSMNLWTLNALTAQYMKAQEALSNQNRARRAETHVAPLKKEESK